MKTIFTPLLIISLSCNITFAQQDWDMTPQPPDAATFSTYGTYPVSYYTGTPDISIPLFNINEGEVSVPITLSYNGRGVRVADESTWVGLGWNLYPGGSISRVVMGSQYDNHDTDMYNVFLNHWQNNYEVEWFQKDYTTNYWGKLTEGEIYSIESGLGNQGYFTDFSTTTHSAFTGYDHMFQPNIYTFNFLGYSGKFYIDPEIDEIIIIDKKEHLVIEKDTQNWDPEVNGWKVYLPTGVQVFFQDIERVHQSITDPDCSSSAPSLTWKITKIILKNGDEIDFNYTNTTYQSASISDNSIIAFEDDMDYQLNRYKSGYGSFEVPFLQNNCPSNGRPLDIDNNLKTLTQITSPKYTIDFSTVAGTEKPILSSIEITDNCDASFKIGFNFSISPFSCADGAWNEWTNRAGVKQTYREEENFVKYKLTQLQKYTSNSGIIYTSENPYIFEYREDIGLPSIFSFAQDYWGYYNGENANTGLIPDESQMYATGGPYPEQNLPYPEVDVRAKANSNRGSSSAHMVQGILEKIVYPTGGNTSFIYEPNKFYLSDMSDYILLANEINYNGLHFLNNYNGSSSAISTGAGLRIKEIVNSDYDGQFLGRKKFNYAQSGILLEPVHFWKIEPQVQVIPNGDMQNQYMMDDELLYYKIWSASSSNHNQSFAIPNSVGYSHVEVIESDSEVDGPNEKFNGKTVYKFHNYETVYNLQTSRVTVGYLDSRNGLPQSIEIFDNEGVSLKRTVYDYEKIDNSMFLAIAIKHINASSVDGYNIFKIEYTPMKADWWKQSNLEETIDGSTITTYFDYAKDTYSNGRLLTQTTHNSENEEIVVNYYYAQDNPPEILTTAATIDSMIGKNMVGIPLKTEKSVNGARVEGNIVNYGSNLYPNSFYSLDGNAYNLQQSLIYVGNKIVQATGKDGISTSFLWGCNYTKPVAKGVGVDYTTFSGAYNALGGNLDGLFSYAGLSHALITTYTHVPLSGIGSQRDPNGIITYYEYDDMGRLKLIKDDGFNIVKHQQYHYKEQ